MDNKSTIQAFKAQDDRVIQQLYHQYKPKFENWLKGRFGIGRVEDGNEIYQRSFTILYFNVKRGKLDNLDVQTETYLYGVGKMVMKEWWREKSGTVETTASETFLEEPDLFKTALDEGEIDHDLQQRLATALNALGEPCKTILKLFYWERNSMEAIARKTGYKNELGAKKKKYLCLTKLKELMQDEK